MMYVVIVVAGGKERDSRSNNCLDGTCGNSAVSLSVLGQAALAAPLFATFTHRDGSRVHDRRWAAESGPYILFFTGK